LPGSIVFEASKIEKLQDSFLFKYIKWGGKKIGIPSGFPSELKKQLKPWALKNKMATSGI